MLKVIDSGRQDGFTVLRLEGRVVGPWVEELRQASQKARGLREPLRLDLGEVSYLDAAGIDLLCELAGEGVALVNASAFVAEQLRAFDRG